MNNDITTILCSGVALGVYIPAILVDYQLKKEHINTDVVVLENLLPDDIKSKIVENKKAFHKNFRFALAGQKISKDLWPLLDMNKIENLFSIWKIEKRRKFIIFSGFWMSIINEYGKKSGFNDLNIDIIHMDADISVSWKHFENECKSYNNIWLYSYDNKKLIYEIAVSGKDPIAYNHRNNRFIIHGGGWGMGTYQNKIPELQSSGINLDIIIYFLFELDKIKNDDRCFMINPEWAPWIKNKNNYHEFPPFGEIKEHVKPEFKNRMEYHEMYDLICMSKGIISKPGGATLLDSLSSATPIIMLEPFGEYEYKNSELWKHLGFGIYYDEWKKQNYSCEILETLHENILRQRLRQINYISDYMKRQKE
jgi:hypothetical protein